MTEMTKAKNLFATPEYLFLQTRGFSKRQLTGITRVLPSLILTGVQNK